MAGWNIPCFCWVFQVSQSLSVNNSNFIKLTHITYRKPPRRSKTVFHWTSVPGKLGVPVASDNTSTFPISLETRHKYLYQKDPSFVLPKKKHSGKLPKRCLERLDHFTQGMKSQSLSIPHFVSKFLPWSTEELEIIFGESEAFRVILHHLAKSLLQHFRECPIENRMRFPPHKVSSESDAKSKLNSQPEFLTSQAQLEEPCWG